MKSNEKKGQEYMLLMTYGAEKKAVGKYSGLVEQIRRWYDDKDDLPTERMAKCH